MSCPLDSERRKTLQEVVGKVQGLVRAARLGWGMVASPYTIHGGNKFLWTVGGVELEVNGSDVARMILRNLVQEYGILPHSRTYYCLLFSLYHMFIVFVISY